MNEVLIILTSFSRPQNMPEVIRAWREQTVKCRIVVVDNAPLTQHTLGEGEWIEKYPNDYSNGVDEVIRFTENRGCPCWMMPALMEYKAKYILRCDDDFVPGNMAVEMLLRFAEDLGDKFSTIGQVGRRFRDGKYHRGNVTRDDVDPVKVDLTCRVSFMKTETVAYVPLYRNLLLKHVDQFPNVGQLVGVHDDFLLCMAAQYYTRQPSYIIPRTGVSESMELVLRELDQGNASVYKRGSHFQERDDWVRLATTSGWRSLV